MLTSIWRCNEKITLHECVDCVIVAQSLQLIMPQDWRHIPHTCPRSPQASPNRDRCPSTNSRPLGWPPAGSPAAWSRGRAAVDVRPGGRGHRRRRTRVEPTGRVGCWGGPGKGPSPQLLRKWNHGPHLIMLMEFVNKSLHTVAFTTILHLFSAAKKLWENPQILRFIYYHSLTFNPFAFTNCVCIGLAVFAFKALEIPCLFAFSGGKTQKCKYYYWNCCNSKSLHLTSYKFHTMYVKTLHYSQMLINVYEINVLTVKI